MNFKYRNAKYAFLIFTLTFSSAFFFQNCGIQNPNGLSSQKTEITPTNLFSNSNMATAPLNSPPSNIPLTTAQIVLDSDIKCLPPSDTSIPVSKHLKYFGMLSSMTEDTTNFENWKSDIMATLKMGNMQGVEYVQLANDPDYTKSIALLKQKINFLAQYKINIVLIVQKILFDSNGKPFTNYTANWSKILNAVNAFKPLIKSIYLFDEPFWNVLTNQKKGNTSYVSNAEMYNNLNIVGSLMHQTLPDAALVFVEAYPMVNENLKIPDIFDWIGMDCYTGFESCEGHSIPEYYQILKKLQPNKKLVVLPPAMIFKKPQDIQMADRMKVKDIFLSYMNWIASEPNIITSLSFIYRYDQTIEVFTGANKICESADIHRLFWKKFSRLLNEGYKAPHFECTGTGILNSYSMTFNVIASNYDINMPGHYFTAGYNILNKSWYLYANNQWSLYDGSESSIISFPTNAISSNLSGILFSQQDLSSAPNGQFYLGYGIGLTKMEAWNNMLNNIQYSHCSTLPAN